MSRYTQNDKICTHCGGAISGHSCEDEDKVIYWCDVCGANDKDTPPYIGIAMHEKGRN